MTTYTNLIPLQEKIVQALQRMKCPYALEPHQIQGLDYIHLFPIIQWLVKKAIATREAEGDKIRQFAIKQFHKENPEDKIDDLNGIDKVLEKTKIKRMYKKKDEADDNPETTMLEYGQRKLRSIIGKITLLLQYFNFDLILKHF